MENASYLRLTLSEIGESKSNLYLRYKNETTESVLKIDDSLKASIKITPNYIKFHRKVGEHNTIDTELTVLVTKQEGDDELPSGLQASIFFALKQFFVSNNVILDKCIAKKEQAEEVVDTPDTHLAEKYQVVSVFPSFEVSDASGYTFKVTLKITSWDYLLDKTKYSCTYTAKRLGEDIFKGFVAALANDLKCETKDMRILRQTINRKDKDNKDISETIELFQPYLVQYNETEYSFLLRNANRCGEFLYFENGILHLGLHRFYVPENAAGQNAAKEVTQEIQNANISALKHEYLLDEESHAFSQNAFKNTSDPVSSLFRELNGKPYVAEYSNDDYFRWITKDGYDKQDEWKKLYPKWVFRVFSEVFKMEATDLGSIFDGVNNAFIKINEFTETRSETAQTNYTDKYFSKNDINAKKSQYSADGDSCAFAQFSDLYNPQSQSQLGPISSTNKPSTAVFFNMIKAERSNATQQYSISEDSADKCYWLGQIVTLHGVKDAGASEDKRFIVVQIDSENRYEDSNLTVNKTIITIIPEGRLPLPLPASVEPFRNAGAQPAVVIDAEDPERIGRVRIKYHWQSSDSAASPWIRVTTPYASCVPSDEEEDDTEDPGSGMYFKLNKGDEVMVDYEGGNIERPYVVGSVYGGYQQNNGRKVPFGGRNYSHVFRSRYGHTIAIREPSTGTGIVQSIFPGLSLFAGIPGFSDMVTDEGTEAVRQGLGGFDIRDKYGLYSITTSSDARNISIDSPFGTVNISAAMGITVSAPNGNVKIVGKNVEIVAGNNLTLKSGANINRSLSSLFKKSIGASAVAKQKLLDPFVNKIVGIFDVPALRFIIELLVKPVQGTLKVHSGRHLMLEANNNDAPMPVETFKNNQLPIKGNRYGALNDLLMQVGLSVRYMKSYLEAYKATYNDGVHKKNGVIELVNEIVDSQFVINNLETLIVAEDDDFDDVTVKQFIYGVGFDNNIVDTIASANVYIAIDELRSISKSISDKTFAPQESDLYKEYKQSANHLLRNPNSIWNPQCFLNETNIEQITKFKLGENAPGLFVADCDKKIKEYVRSLMVGSIQFSNSDQEHSNAKVLKSNFASDFDVSQNNNWSDFVRTLELNPNYEEGTETLFWDYVRNDIGMKLANKVVPVDTIDFLKSWDPNSTGDILFSDANSPSVRIRNKHIEDYLGNNSIKKLQNILSNELTIV